MVVHAQYKFEQHRAKTRSVFTRVAVPYYAAFGFKQYFKKLFQGTAAVVAEKHGFVHTRHIVVRRTELGFYALAFVEHGARHGFGVRYADGGGAYEWEIYRFYAVYFRVRIFVLFAFRAQIDYRGQALFKECGNRLRRELVHSAAADKFVALYFFAVCYGESAQVASIIKFF